ncbi:fibronectin type III-like domain-contianing protein [Nocardia sp. NPDC002869]|uniref:fibronectin type III-like domain-contianing protein n=1 Tax=Nocardia sp. NPDC002869 TaxID=3161032 RepID=UPI00398CC7A0
MSFPFGHGLTYTTFAYAEPHAASDADSVTVTVRVANTGARAGREVVQVYTSPVTSSMLRPPRELGGFATVELEPGAADEVTVRIPRREFARWHEPAGRWIVEGGEYILFIGRSSRDLPVRATVRVDGDEVRVPLTRESAFAEVMANPVAGPELGAKLGPLVGEPGSSAGTDLGVDMARMIGSIPIGRIALNLGGLMTAEELDDLLARANG